MTLKAETDCPCTAGKNATGSVPDGASPAAIASGPVVGVVGNGDPPPTVNSDYKFTYSACSQNVPTNLQVIKVYVPAPG